MTLSDKSSILYVRIGVEDKRRLKILADKDFEGSVAACIRYLLKSYLLGPAGRPTRRPVRNRGGHLDED